MTASTSVSFVLLILRIILINAIALTLMYTLESFERDLFLEWVRNFALGMLVSYLYIWTLRRAYDEACMEGLLGRPPCSLVNIIDEKAVHFEDTTTRGRALLARMNHWPDSKSMLSKQQITKNLKNIFTLKNQTEDMKRLWKKFCGGCPLFARQRCHVDKTLLLFLDPAVDDYHTAMYWIHLAVYGKSDIVYDVKVRKNKVLKIVLH